MNATLIATWLLTYLIHSTFFLCAALVVTRIMGERRLAVQETLLRTALIGGVVTASLQIALGISPLAGVVALDSSTQVQMAVPATFVESTDATISYPANTTAIQANDFSWSAALIVLWSVGSILALFAVLRSILDLRRLLQTRCFHPASRLVENLASAMGLRKRVKLSTSKAIAVPFATGIRRPEICCPERVEELAREHRTSLFAHEMAHLARRDPAWQLLYRLGEAVLVLQPLNCLARRRLEEIAEHLTDERAVSCTGDRLGLARCLVVVAHWGISSPVGLPATAFSAGPRLDRRVQRLISGISDRSMATRWALLLVSTILVGAVAVLPTVGASSAHAEQSVPSTDDTTTWSISIEESGSVVTQDNTWSVADEGPDDAPPPPDQPAPAEAATVAPMPDVSPLNAPPAPAAAPRPDTKPAAAAPPRPSAEPRSATAPNPVAHSAPHAPDEPPTPTEEPSPTSAPTPPEAPEDLAAGEAELRRFERERARAVARERDTAETRERSEERALARERAHEERARERDFRAEEIERRTAERLSHLELEREALREKLEQLHAGTEVMAREEARAASERARALAIEANALEREAARRGEELTQEQRKELQLKALELRAHAEAQRQEMNRETIERARELSEKTRRIVEEAEAERRKLEQLEEQEKRQ